MNPKTPEDVSTNRQSKEELIEVRARDGMTLELARMLLCRTAYLDTDVTLEGVDLRVRGAPSLRVVRELYRASLASGDVARVVATGQDAELAVAEIRHLLAYPEPDPHGACEYANRGPRGEPSTEPGKGPYIYATSEGGLHNLFSLARQERP